MLNRICLLCALALPAAAQLGNILDPPPLHMAARDGKTELVRSQLAADLSGINSQVLSAAADDADGPLCIL